MLKVGIVGMGIRGNLYAETVKHNPHAEVIAVSESDESRLKDSAKSYRVKTYTDFRDMLGKERFDLAIVALPDHLHKDAVIAAAQKGCHLLIEKPLATSSEDAQQMVQTIKKAGIKALVGFENRWNPAFISAKEAIDSGEIGDVRILFTCLNDSIFVPTQMLGWAARSTPAWFLFPHTIDMTLWLTGKKVKRVYGRGVKKVLKEMGIDTFDSISAIVEFTDGTSGTYNTCWIYPESIPLVYDLRFDFVGSKGAISVDLRDQMIHKMTTTYSHPPTLGKPIHGKPLGFAAEMLNCFIDNIRLNTEPLVDIEDGLYVVEVIDRIHRSIETGKIEPMEEK
ncbi:MAG: oxidoreductase [Spirochaetes bacterium DG_61]|nr:MAG: oxidoreductase [Spirochaetes bacterium DG_61]